MYLKPVQRENKQRVYGLLIYFNFGVLFDGIIFLRAYKIVIV